MAFCKINLDLQEDYSYFRKVGQRVNYSKSLFTAGINGSSAQRWSLLRLTRRQHFNAGSAQETELFEKSLFMARMTWGFLLRWRFVWDNRKTLLLSENWTSDFFLRLPGWLHFFSGSGLFEKSLFIAAFTWNSVHRWLSAKIKRNITLQKIYLWLD